MSAVFLYLWIKYKTMDSKEMLTEYLKKEGYNDSLVNDTQFRKVMANTIKFRFYEMHHAKIRLIDRILEVFGIK